MEEKKQSVTVLYEEHTQRSSEHLNVAPAINNISNDVVIGILVGFSDRGQPLVAFTNNGADICQPALYTGHLSYENAGKRVALLFPAGDVHKPMIIGIVRDNIKDAINVNAQSDQSDSIQTNTMSLQINQRKIELNAEDEIVLRCGRARIELSKNGHVAVKGLSIDSSAEKLHRIKGAKTEIN